MDTPWFLLSKKLQACLLMHLYTQDELIASLSPTLPQPFKESFRSEQS